jgi:hypothetical protein
MPTRRDGRKGDEFIAFIGRAADAWKNFNTKNRLSLQTVTCGEGEEEAKVEWASGTDFELFGTSICGDDTALLTEGGRLGLDAGPSASKLPLPDVIFLSHHHHDHISGVPEVSCKSARLGKPVTILVGRGIPREAAEWLEAVSGSVPGSKVTVEYVSPGQRVKWGEGGRDALEFFETNHSRGSLGVSVLRGEGPEMRKHITYTGDIDLSDPEMNVDPHILEAEHLITEASHLGSPLSEGLYQALSHSSFDDSKRLLERRSTEPKSVTYVHLPYAKVAPVSCGLVEMKIKDHRAGDVGYIPSCLGLGKGAMSPSGRKSLKGKPR